MTAKDRRVQKAKHEAGRQNMVETCFVNPYNKFSHRVEYDAFEREVYIIEHELQGLI